MEVDYIVAGLGLIGGVGLLESYSMEGGPHQVGRIP